MVLLLLASLFCGCKTSRFFARRSERAVVETKVDVVETSTTKVDRKSTEAANEKVEILEDITETTTTVKWSEPDSSGRQFAVETTVRVRSSAVNTKVGLSAEKTEDVRREIDRKSVETSLENSSVERKSTETAGVKRSTPAWMVWGAVILSGGLMFLVYRVLRRYKVVSG